MKEKVKETWQDFSVYPAHTKTSLFVILFVAVSIPLSVVASLSKTGLFSRASYAPVSSPSPLPPESCKRGVKWVNLYSGWFNNKGSCPRGRGRTAAYSCINKTPFYGWFDAGSGNCHSSDEFYTMAVAACEKISEPACGLPEITPTPTPASVKGFGKAIKIGQEVGYIKIPASTSLLMGHDFTVEAWIRPEESVLRGVNPNFIIAGPTIKVNKTTFLWQYALSVSNHEVTFWFGFPGNSSLNKSLSEVLQSKTKLEAGKWYHVVGGRMYNTFYLLVNGRLEKKKVVDVVNYDGPVAPAPITIGCSLADFGEKGWFCMSPFEGLIDEVRISRTFRYKDILSQEPFKPDLATQALWHFDGNAKDSSSNGNDGQTIGDVKFVDSTIPGPTSSEADFDQAAKLFNNKDKTNYMKIKTADSGDVLGFLAKKSGTVEAWVKLNKNIKNRVGVLSQGGVGNLSLLPVRGGRYRLFFGSQQFGNAMGGSADGQLVTPGRWHHIALTKEADSGMISLFLDGKKVGYGGKKTAAKAGLLSSLRRKENSQPGAMIIGGRQLDSGRVVNGFPGLIDELRFSSQARYKGDFVVSKKPFSLDDDTLVLWRFNKNLKDEVKGLEIESVGQVDFAPSLAPVWAL